MLTKSGISARRKSSATHIETLDCWNLNETAKIYGTYIPWESLTNIICKPSFRQSSLVWSDSIACPQSNSAELLDKGSLDFVPDCHAICTDPWPKILQPGQKGLCPLCQLMTRSLAPAFAYIESIDSLVLHQRCLLLCFLLQTLGLAFICVSLCRMSSCLQWQVRSKAKRLRDLLQLYFSEWAVIAT